MLLSADDRPITVLKFDSSSSSLYAASLNCSLKRIDWAALRMQCLVSKKNRLDCLEYTQFKVLSPVSCLELIRDSLKENQPDPSFGK